MHLIDKFKTIFSLDYSDDAVRQQLMFRLLNIVLCFVSLVMSILNIFTQETTLFFVTAIYSALCAMNYVLDKKGFRVQLPFALETTAMLSFFIVTGIPAGFSVLWTLLIPACALHIFGAKHGTVFSTLLFLMITFFFWLPAGKIALIYDYSETFMMRFPFVYVCIYLISFYVEWIRKRTFERLIQTENDYRKLYRHDALTKLYSRHAFYEEVTLLRAAPNSNAAGILMLDIDDFKSINDRYGHNIGDIVLCKVADTIQANTCQHCISCRWGGEEFLVLMKCEHDPMMVAESIRKQIEKSYVFNHDGKPVQFTISVGVSIGSIDSQDQLIEQINCADQALYASKRNGKNQSTLIYGDK